MNADKKLCLDYNNMMSDFIGPHGLSCEDFDRISPKFGAACVAMKQKRSDGAMDWRDLPHEQVEVVEDILAYAKKMSVEVEYFVLLGIGGSALGPMAVHQALLHPYYNDLPKSRRGPKFYIVDNVDPERLVYLFQVIDITKCLFNVVSKSGQTAETMSQFMIVKERLESAIGKEQAKERIVITTDSEKGDLIKIAKAEGYKTFAIPSGVGGRFSQLSPVGLLPAAICGIDIKELLHGAAFMDELCNEDDVFKNPAYTFAALHYAALLRGASICVMMPYAERLKFVADWFVQLWAESLGKKYDNDGNIVNSGQTPIKALGATDQHAQVQLFAHGPYDKLVVFIGVSEFHEEIEIPKILCDMPSIGFLGGHTHGELLRAEQEATEYALQKEGRMNMTITLPKVCAHTVGQLLYMLEVATAFMGELMNINAFDQPGVEEGKNAAYAMLGRPGYKEKKKELEERPRKKDEYVV